MKNNFLRVLGHVWDMTSTTSAYNYAAKVEDNQSSNESASQVPSKISRFDTQTGAPSEGE